ncbi:Baseplate_J domain-containing protein [Rubrivivax sp. A210]|uniref:baseplate J/gp47 family protein n=1 Tax=Rubrivivax sp. A210 TaxID=2772301 RepID=UPI00191B3C3F|nr:baseplate J/gp47 family protein [Rubrivivax sp. A210]CAD5372271.1 Baseplate_J domain-containing protein [Rubrivivax sp. A210]
MANGLPSASAIARDGTSQSGRVSRELAPGFALVDERSTRDLLAFARAHARELRYFGLADPEQTEGDWSGFIGDIDLDAAAAYAQAPEAWDEDRAAPLARPHFALFLVFLELLARVREQINTFTGRHLEFHYRDVLRMVRKAAVPDRVHVLVELEAGTPQLLLPAATALRGGVDNLGRELVYRTEREIVANRVQVAALASLHAEIRITGIAEAIDTILESVRRNNTGLKQEGFLALLRIALGQPNAGDPLPVPIYSGVPAPSPQGAVVAVVVDFAALLQVQRLVNVAELALGMPHFDDLRLLMRLRQLRQPKNERADWTRINAILEAAGRMRLGNPSASFGLADSGDFMRNLATVLGKTDAEMAELFNGLLEVKSMEDAYEVYLHRSDVQRFIRNRLFLSLDDFKALMQAKTVMDNQWAEIDRLLQDAGRVKKADPLFELPKAVRLLHDFAAKLAAALGTPDYTVTGGLDAWWQSLQDVERWFRMPAEACKFMLEVVTRTGPAAADPWDWARVGEILAAAHAELIHARRRNALLDLARAQPADRLAALAAMLVRVLDTKPPEGGSLKTWVDEALKTLEALNVGADALRDLGAVAAGTDTAPDWARFSQVLEVAQSNREAFKVPVAERLEWRNLYPAADARAVLARTARDQALPRWRTFGEGEVARTPEPVPAPVFGWALASPLLALSEGQRTVALTLGYSNDPLGFELAKVLALLAPTVNAQLLATVIPFQIELSTAKGWMQPDSQTLSWLNANMDHPRVAGVDTSKLRALQLNLAIAKGKPALAPPTRELHGMEAAAPVLRLMLKPVWSEVEKCYLSPYPVLRRLLLMRVRLGVTASGMQGLQIRNDETVLDAKKPFEPFGIRPATGSRFTVGHPEIVGKRLDTLAFRITWMGVPPLLATHYANYPGALANASFKVAVWLNEAGVHRKVGEPALFATTATDEAVLTLAPPADQGNPGAAQAGAADVGEWNRNFIWELSAPDFQHAAYPALALQKSLELAAAIANKTGTTTVNPALYQLNPPYTPKVKSLSLDYSASVDLTLDAGPAAGTATAERLFHVEPFGWRELQRQATQPGCPWLPQYSHEGELYIGLAQVNALQNVSLLFQVADGSANPELAPEPVQWSYLSGDRWLTLHEGGLLADGTRGFINSGIVEFALQPAKPSTLLAPGLYWLRAAITRRAGSVCDMVAIHANAVAARFDDQDNAPDHLAEPLPAKRIKAPVAPVPGLLGLQQPYTSFGGKTAERDGDFHVRVAERLRHKQRALTPWDYERLVLERFPHIFKVKCLSADPQAHPRQAGLIELVVIPDIRNRFQYDPFEPKAPADVIRDIETYLQDKTPPCASVKVKNAHYVPVKVRCGVRFVAGADEGFSRLRLNEELNRFLSPWAYQEGEDLVIGGSVYANSLINFIELRDYVDYIAEFKLFTSEDEGKTFNMLPVSDNYHARAGRPDGVLVAAHEHDFDVITQADYRLEGHAGINYMKIELDFMVA